MDGNQAKEAQSYFRIHHRLSNACWNTNDCQLLCTPLTSDFVTNHMFIVAPTWQSQPYKLELENLNITCGLQTPNLHTIQKSSVLKYSPAVQPLFIDSVVSQPFSPAHKKIAWKMSDQKGGKHHVLRHSQQKDKDNTTSFDSQSRAHMCLSEYVTTWWAAIRGPSYEFTSLDVLVHQSINHFSSFEYSHHYYYARKEPKNCYRD